MEFFNVIKNEFVFFYLNKSTKMEFSSAFIYSMRFAQKSVVPEAIMTSISKLRLIPAVYRPVKIVKPKHVRRVESDNWRESSIREMHRRIRETTDPHYDEMLGIFNKVSQSNLKTLAEEALKIMKSQDEEFRLRVVTLLFDKAIKGSAYAAVMADLVLVLSTSIPEIADDLNVQIKMFTSLYDMNETLTFPSSTEPDFNEKVIAWSKQKDVRRGYSRFLTHIYIRNIIPGDVLHISITRVLDDLENSVSQPKTEKLEEIITQYADFLFEIGKLLPPTAVELRGLLETRIGSILMRPRVDLPALNMRSRFKLEDAQKCVKAC
jgi:hypothetical protein